MENPNKIEHNLNILFFPYLPGKCPIRAFSSTHNLRQPPWIKINSSRTALHFFRLILVYRVLIEIICGKTLKSLGGPRPILVKLHVIYPIHVVIRRNAFEKEKREINCENFARHFPACHFDIWTFSRWKEDEQKVSVWNVFFSTRVWTRRFPKTEWITIFECRHTYFFFRWRPKKRIEKNRILNSYLAWGCIVDRSLLLIITDKRY